MSGLSLSVAGELCNDWSRVCACLGGGSILPGGGGGVSVCALHGGSRLLLHYQLLRKPAVIFSLFLPVSNAKGHPIVSGVTHICNFYCCLICINQLVRWKRQNYLFIWSNECYCSHDDLVFHRLQDLFCLPFVFNWKTLLNPTLLKLYLIWACHVQELDFCSWTFHCVKMYNMKQQ